MSRHAQLYIWSVLLTGAGIGVAALLSYNRNTADWTLFAVLTLLAVITQFWRFGSAGRHSYYPHFVFFFAGILLLQPALFAVQILAAHLVEWFKARIGDTNHLQAWYVQPFNVATHLVAAGSAYIVYTILHTKGIMQVTPQTVSVVMLAAAVYVVVNHLLIGGALTLARGIPWSESKVLSAASLLSDFVPASLGYVLAVLWYISPWLIVPALAPLALIRQALKVHVLEEKARVDSKTGLLNAEHFMSAVEQELARAERLDRPVGLIMADLDLLRNINNTYGHIAGDAVLAGVADIIQDSIRETDVGGRFGGEEFAILLPEISLEKAEAIAEHIRSTVESSHFNCEATQTQIQATLSLGVACFPTDAMEAKRLIHEADIAVYRAKLAGRNQVVSVRDLPRSGKLEHNSEDETASAGPAGPAYSGTTGADNHSANGTAEPHTPEQSTADAGGKSTAIRDLLLPAFVTTVVLLGVLLFAWGVLYGTEFDLRIVAVLGLLAIAAEYLHINAYEDTTLSVSVAIVFASALLAGIPGVAIISAVMALTHAVQMRPSWYKVAFNWSTHVITGAAPAVLIGLVAMPTSVGQILPFAAASGVAALLYFVLDTGLIAMAISLSTGRSLAFIWNKQFRWSGGQYIILALMGIFLSIGVSEMGLAGIVVFALPVFMMRYSQKQYVERTQASLQELKRMNQELDTANREITRANEAFQELNNELFETLAKIIDARDPFNKGHAATVADYAVEIGKELGLSDDRLHALRQAGLLHDIGKLGIPETILFKPDKLTAEEYERIKLHSTIGARFLETSQGLNHLVPFVRYHHERWDGAGYPAGLAGEDIPLEARILAVCDAVEAMASDRPYSAAKPLDEIIAELKRNKGTQFDPVVTEAFIEIVHRNGSGFVRNSAEIVREARPGFLFPLNNIPSPAA